MTQAHKNSPRIVLLTTLFALLLFPLSPTAALAQSAQDRPTDFQNQDLSLTIAPPSLEMTGRPGETISREITIGNLANKKANLQIVTNDFALDASGNIQRIEENTLTSDSELKRFLMKNWITTSVTSLTLGAGAQEKIGITITIPDNATPGGHYAVVSAVEKGKEESEKPSNIGIRGSIGSLILVTIPGAFDKTGSVHNLTSGVYEKTKGFTPHFIFAKDGLTEKQSIDFAFDYYNGSATHERPRGIIIIKNIFGGDIGKVEIPDARVFPGMSRQIYTHFEGSYLFGLYEAEATIIDAQGENHQLTTHFLVLPLTFTLTMIGFMAALIFGAFWYRRWLEKSLRRKIQGE